MRLAVPAFALAALLIPTEAVAQFYCGPYAVVKNMIERHEERLHFRGLSRDGTQMMEIFIDAREESARGFTVIIQQALKDGDTKTCVVFSGFGFNENVLGDTPWAGPQGEPS
jgi:hypothetical protein